MIVQERVDFFKRKQQELGIILNEVQQQVVTEVAGPLLLLASPGSGKTTTIIMRIGYLIEQLATEPSKIKAVTFSKAAAADMSARFKKWFPHLPPVDFSTIHSFAYEVMRQYFYKKQRDYYIIEGEQEQSETIVVADGQQLPLHKKIILRHLYKTVVGEMITDDQLEELTTFISYTKNKMIAEDKWGTVAVQVPQAAKIQLEYERFKQADSKRVLVDFDDMLLIALEALEQDRELLQRYQQQYDYLLTDESQDTSLVQHMIIASLVAEHNNLCVVADDDQSIYSWRGADPAYLLQFQEVYPAAKVLYLEQNYRSTANIVEVAAAFIKKNKQRYVKQMFTSNLSADPIEVVHVPDDRAQTLYIIEQIQAYEELTEVAILYRNNTSSIPIMNALDLAGIPFYMKDADNRFFSHWIVEDILNFMRMTFTDKRADIFEKIHLKCGGYISKQQMAAVIDIQNGESVFDNLLTYGSLQDYQYKQVESVKETLLEMRGMPPLPAIHVIRERLGYDKALDKMVERLGFRKEYLLGILSTLEEIASPLATMEQFAARLKYLAAELKQAKYRKGQRAVTLSTMHSAKGLEFEQVYMIDLLDQVIPAKQEYHNELDVEEARRLFYVAMTRAKHKLTLMTYGKRGTETVVISPFVAEVRKIISPTDNKPTASASHTTSSLMKIQAGSAVQHRIFGRGVVTIVEGESITVQFEQETKQLSLAICVERGLLTENIPQDTSKEM